MPDPSNHLYSEKSRDYFAHARMDIASLLPTPPRRDQRILEIGCSGGHTLEWLKTEGHCGWAAGVEPFAEFSATPGTVDQFYKLDIEKELPPIEDATIDTILCLDVLEHLVDPWTTVRRLDKLLKPGGSWIVSVPNMRNYHVILDLAFKGRFDYTQDGILDRTHLRFFTRASLISMMESCGAQVTTVLGTETSRWQKRLLNKLGFGDLLAKQLLVQAVKPSSAKFDGTSSAA